MFDLLTTKKYGSISSSFDVGVNGLEMGGTVCRERMGGENLGICFLIAQKKDFAIKFGGKALVGRYGQISGLEEVGVHSSLERGIHVANIMGDVAREMGWAHPGDPECWPEGSGILFLVQFILLVGVRWECQGDLGLKLAAPSGWPGSLGRNSGNRQRIVQLEQGPSDGAIPKFGARLFLRVVPLSP